MKKENKGFMNYSFDEVMRLDQSLQYLASYEVTKGRIAIPKSQDEMIELNEKIANKFNYFKSLIQRGECTFDFIRNSVLGKNGAFPRDVKPIDFSDPKCFEQVVTDQEPQGENFDKKSNINESAFVEQFISYLFPDFKAKKSGSHDKEIQIEMSVSPDYAKKPIKPPKKNNRKRKKNEPK